MVERKEKQVDISEDKVTIQEVPIDLTLINNKLNYIITLLEQRKG